MRENIGIDIGKRKCDVCVIDAKGNVLERRQYQNTTAKARKFAEDMARKYKECRAACETTGNMWNITFDVLDAGIKTKLANTFKMAIIARTGKKTDKIDAEKIAQILRMDMIPECYVPPSDIRGIRAMIRQRIRMVQDRTRVIKVHSMLDRHDVTVDAVNMYAKKELRRLESARLKSSHDSMVLGQCVRQIRHLTEEIAVMEE